MIYLIIFIVVALVLSPVFWMMPSPKQKRQIQLRQRAMALGLQVKVCDLPQTHRAMVRKESPEQGVVYRLLWRRADTENENFHFLCLRDDDERANGATQTVVEDILSDALASMGDIILAVEYSHAGLAIYWRENDAVERVDQIFQQLQSLQQALSGIDMSSL